MAQRVLVTGGASGLGAALCELIESRGDTAVAADVVPRAGGVSLDVRDPEAWERALDAAGPIDGLVNCAGIRTRDQLIDMDPEVWDRVLAVNLRGPFLGIRAVARRWRLAERGGSIVNIASVGGLIAIAGQSHYVASKGGLIALTKAAAIELADAGVRVNAVAPGVITTPLTEERMKDPAQRAFFESRIPLRRFADATEIAEAVLFLLSPRSSYTTGATLPVDGGWTAV